MQNAWLVDESVWRLNSEATYKAFIDQWETVDEVPDDLAENRNKPHHPCRAFREFLD
jgi:hypothetical protein